VGFNLPGIVEWQSLLTQNIAQSADFYSKNYPMGLLPSFKQVRHHFVGKAVNQRIINHLKVVRYVRSNRTD
jgi:hypothetical protein